MKLLFWNLEKKEINEEVLELIQEQEPTIVAFSEGCGINITDLINSLKSDFNKNYEYIDTPGCDKIKVLKVSGLNISLMNQNKDYSLMSYIYNNDTYLLGFVHLPSKLHQTEEQQRRACERLYKQINLEEVTNDISKSIIIGDFNVNPFESPMLSFSGLAATNGIDCSLRDSIVSDGETKKLFFNPMWTLYGQYKDRPGSHRYVKTGVSVASWHFLDQVIIRPLLIEHFDFNELKFISKTSNYSFVNRNGTPSTSDHLPLVCKFNI
ncbi:hypothetical protein [Aliivibrio logei]|uniref:hypothetical protein n=1 Tax=Aliivibrio logei TaxID=688 RepID=UPI0035C8CA60